MSVRNSIMKNVCLYVQISIYFRAYLKQKGRWRPKAQYAESILNKIAKPFNKTIAGWKSMLQGLQIWFSWNPGLKGIES